MRWHGLMHSRYPAFWAWVTVLPGWMVIHEAGHWIAAWMMGWQPYAITFGTHVVSPIRGMRWGTCDRWRVGRTWCYRRRWGWQRCVFLLAGPLAEMGFAIGVECAICLGVPDALMAWCFIKGILLLWTIPGLAHAGTNLYGFSSPLGLKADGLRVRRIWPRRVTSRK